MFKEWKSIVAWSSFLSQTLLSCWILNSLFLQDGESSSKRRWARFAKRNKCPSMALLPASGKNRTTRFSSYTPHFFFTYVPPKWHVFGKCIWYLSPFPNDGIIFGCIIYSSNCRGVVGPIGCPENVLFFTRKNSKSCSTKCPSWTKDGTSSHCGLAFSPYA